MAGQAKTKQKTREEKISWLTKSNEKLIKEYGIEESKQPKPKKPDLFKRALDAVFKKKKKKPAKSRKIRSMTKQEQLKRVNYLIDTGKELINKRNKKSNYGNKES